MHEVYDSDSGDRNAKNATITAENLISCGKMSRMELPCKSLRNKQNISTFHRKQSARNNVPIEQNEKFKETERVQKFWSFKRQKKSIH